MQPQKKIQIIMVDDHRSARQAYSRYINQESNMEVIGEAANGHEALQLLETRCDKPDIMLLDLEMPVMNGHDTLEVVLKRFPKVKVIILTQVDEHTYITELLLKGASAYLLKSCDMTEIIQTINYVHSEGYHFDRSLSHSIVSTLIQRKSTPSIFDRYLSEREIEIVKLICQNKSNKEIAVSLYITIDTVKHHRKNINKKMNAKSVIPLVKYALKHGIVGFD